MRFFCEIFTSSQSLYSSSLTICEKFAKNKIIRSAREAPLFGIKNGELSKETQEMIKFSAETGIATFHSFRICKLNMRWISKGTHRNDALRLTWTGCLSDKSFEFLVVTACSFFNNLFRLTWQMFDQYIIAFYFSRLLFCKNWYMQLPYIKAEILSLLRHFYSQLIFLVQLLPLHFPSKLCFKCLCLPLLLLLCFSRCSKDFFLKFSMQISCY